MGRKLSPPVRVAPLGELRVWTVYEHELDRLAEASPASIMLNFAPFFLGAALSLLMTLLTTTLVDRTYYTFLILCVIGLIAGVVLLVLWWRMYESTREL